MKKHHRHLIFLIIHQRWAQSPAHDFGTITSRAHVAARLVWSGLRGKEWVDFGNNNEKKNCYNKSWITMLRQESAFVLAIKCAIYVYMYRGSFPSKPTFRYSLRWTERKKSPRQRTRAARKAERSSHQRRAPWFAALCITKVQTSYCTNTFLNLFSFSIVPVLTVIIAVFPRWVAVSCPARALTNAKNHE